VSEGKEISWSNLIIAIFFYNSICFHTCLKRQSNSSSSISGFFR